MVKQDKKSDILDFLLGTGIDLSEILTPDSEVFPMTRFETTEPMTSPWQRPDSNPTPQEMEGSILSVEELSDMDIVGSDVIAEVIVPNIEDHAQLSDSTNSELFYSIDDNTECLIGSFEEVSDESDLVFEEVADADLHTEVDLSPLLKEEIKHKIINRRQMEGKEQIHVEFREPSPERLTPEEERRRLIKREKNKLAAQKCRSKKRKLAESLEQQTCRLEMKQEKLQNEIEKLREERDHLQDLIQIHTSFCPKVAKK